MNQITSKRILPFFAIQALWCMAACFAHPVTPTLIVERQLDSSMFGVALAVTTFMSFLFSPFWGKLCSYIPTKRIMLICCCGYAVGQIIFGSAYSEAQVIAGRAFAGIFTGGCMTSFSNYVVNTTPDTTQRGQNLTVMATIQVVANAIGYFVGGMLGLISVGAAFIAMVVTLALTGVLFYLFCEDDTPYKVRPAHSLSFKEANPFAAFAAAKNFITPMFILLFVIMAISGIGQNSFEQCFNYYIKDQFGLSSAYNGIFKAVIAVVSFIVNSTICIWMVRKTDINRSFLPIQIGSALVLSVVLFFHTLVPFVIVDVVFFAFNAIRMPLMQNMAVQRATPETSNSVMGFYQSMNSMGSIFGSLFAGLIYATDPMLPFYLAFGAFAVAALLSFVYVGGYNKGKK